MGLPVTLALLTLALLAPSGQDGAPRVIATSPLHGEAGVDPATCGAVRVTFDRDMRPEGYSFMGGGPSFPEVTGAPRWEGARTIVLPVRLEPGRVYSMGVGREVGNAFRAAEGGASSVPAPLVFATAELALGECDGERAVARLRALLPGRYSHAATAGVDWGARIDELAPRLRGARSLLELALLVQELGDAAGDPHLSVRLEGFDWTPASGWRAAREATTTRDLSPNVHPRGRTRELERLGGAPSEGPGGMVTASLGGGVRYLMVPTWERGADMGALTEAAVRAMGDFEALVIDVRGNGGGDERHAQRLASLFVGEATPYARRRVLQGDGGLGVPVAALLLPAGTPHPPARAARVAVLVGPGALSSTEGFVLMMRAAGARLVGEATFGSSGNPRPHEVLPGLELLLPSWVTEDLEGRPLERRGIAPDVEVPAPRDGRARRGDPTLVRAVELLLER